MWYDSDVIWYDSEVAKNIALLITFENEANNWRIKRSLGSSILSDMYRLVQVEFIMQTVDEIL